MKGTIGSLKVRRLGYAAGAQITGVDLSRPLDDATVAGIRAAWLENYVVCLPGQDIGPKELLAFGGRLGEIDDLRRTPENRHPDYPGIVQLSNKPIVVNGKKTGGYPAGQRWHSDRQFAKRPGSASLLVAKELPDVGGETMFANMYMAYDTLSPGMKNLLDPLWGVHDLTLSVNFVLKTPEVRERQRTLNPPVAHPVVRVHPETGRKSLFVGENLRNFVGMSDEESKPLIDFLNAHAVRYEFIYRHRWAVGHLLVWDNRCLMHYAVPDYDPNQLRRMLRCALLAEESGRDLEEFAAASQAS